MRSEDRFAVERVYRPLCRLHLPTFHLRHRRPDLRQGLLDQPFPGLWEKICYLVTEQIGGPRKSIAIASAKKLFVAPVKLLELRPDNGTDDLDQFHVVGDVSRQLPTRTKNVENVDAA